MMVPRTSSIREPLVQLEANYSIKLGIHRMILSEFVPMHPLEGKCLFSQLIELQ